MGCGCSGLYCCIPTPDERVRLFGREEKPMIAKRFIVVSRVKDPAGQLSGSFLVGRDYEAPPADRNHAIVLAERLAMENPQNDYYVAELQYHTDGTRTLEVG
jgi:hypothetical protein